MLVTKYWEEECSKLEEKMKNSDCSDFLQWDFIRNDMFHEPSEITFNILKHSKYWELWKNILKEDKFGNPKPYTLCPESSGNLLWHAYSLMQLYDFAPEFDIRNIEDIFEFGGGYGSFCRMVHKMGFNGEYIIYDLPVFCKLQTLYFKNIGFTHKNIGWCEYWPSERLPINFDLFISLWSISESPMELREKILNHLDSKYILIAYQKEFEGVNNVDYFRKLRESKPNYIWSEYEIKNVPNPSVNYYLLGKKS